jgi:hypothetical protein
MNSCLVDHTAMHWAMSGSLDTAWALAVTLCYKQYMYVTPSIPFFYSCRLRLFLP